MLKRLLIILVFVLLSHQVAWGNNAGAFLESGFGSRPISLGKAFTAAADDSNTLYWNTAGISFLNCPALTSTYAKMFDEVGNASIFYVFPRQELGGIGIGFIQTSVDGIPNTDNSGNLLGYVGDTEQALFLGCSRKIRDNFSLGLNFKLLSQSIGGNSNSGYDFDLSSLYKANDFLSFGLNIQNALAGSIGPDKLDRGLKIGAAFRPLPDKLLLTSDLNAVSNKLNLNCGVEWKPSSLLALRFGLSESKIFSGVGLKIKNMVFDYSLNAHELGNVSAFSISMDFNQ